MLEQCSNDFFIIFLPIDEALFELLAQLTSSF